MIEWTRVRLKNWGRWCRGRPVTGYPTASAFMWANTGDRASSNLMDAPTDIAEIDAAVAKLPATLRMPVIAYYVGTGPLWLRAARLRISRRTLMRRVETAERKIDFAIAECPKTVV